MIAKIWALLAVVNVARSRDVIVGSNDIGHKIYDDNKHAGPAIWRQMENLTITTNDTEVLSKIVITDLRAEKDGDARIVDGGEGQKNVTIELKSPTVLRGYEFHIEAYAVAEDQLKTLGQNTESLEHVLKEQSSAATSNAGVTTAVDFDKQITSTTIASPTNEANINRRQNRDTENKDKSTQDIKSATPSLTTTVSTSEISKVPLPNAQTSTTQKADQKFPTVNREFRQGDTFDHPRVNLYEVNKVPESTAKTISLTNVKPKENINTQGSFNSEESNNKTVTNVNTDKIQTHISYPQFGADGLMQTQEPVVNTASPLVEEDKNRNVRHRRDVTNPMEEKKDEQKVFGVNNGGHTSEMTPLNSQEQKHNEEHAVKPRTAVTSEPGSIENQHAQDDAAKSQPNNQPTAFRSRHSHRHFGNANTTHVSLIPTSTEDNKISTLLPKGGESTETANKFTYSQPIQVGKELLGSTSTPNVPEPTSKSGSRAENSANSPLEPKVTDSTITEKAGEFKERLTRDTTSVNNKVEPLLPPVLRIASTTSKLEMDTKNATAKVNTTDTQPILDNTKVPVVKFNTDEISKGTTINPTQSEEKDRNTRGATDFNDKPYNEKVPNDKKDTLDSLKTIKPASILSEHELNESTTKTDERIPSSTAHDNVARDQIPVWNKEDQEDASKTSNDEHENEKGNQQSKILRKENEESKKSNNGRHLSDILLATEKPTSVKPITIENNEKDSKKLSNDDTSKHSEKPE